MVEKDFFISTVRLIDVDGATNIPTVLYYQRGKSPVFGYSALSEESARFKVNEDFKVDIGNIDPTSTRPQVKFSTASGEKKSAIQLTSDFMREVFKSVKEWLKDNGMSQPKNIIICEPLALQSELASSEWLTRYRDNMRRILSGKHYGFESIFFLPEPFAVFQYYRYGHKHPILAQQAKHNALVIDFGGGTFDVCIIETTKEGDIRVRGKHSRPLAASSIPIGGYYLNKMIAEHLLLTYSESKPLRTKIKKGLRIYWDWRKGVFDETTLANEFVNFIHNFHTLIYEVENAKIALSRLIGNWDLHHSPKEAVPISVPSNPFDEDGKHVGGLISATDLKEIFRDKMWKTHLKPNIKRTLGRGKAELKGAGITVVLLSGGSANIGWLWQLIMSEFSEELGDIQIFHLPNFQEVVCQGLAIECARRFYTGDEKGDFSSVTYNRICLIMNPNEYGYHVRPFKNKTDNLPFVHDRPGVLLPSASILEKFIDKPMRWKVKLPRTPSRRLEYRFLRSSLDPNDLENTLNIVDYAVFTPPNIKFDSAIQVEVVVKENGTAFPRFIYKTGPNDSLIHFVKGRPFPIDLTYSQGKTATAFIGLDFGTSNSSISFVDEFSVQSYSKKSAEGGWEELNALVDKLPYPLAVHLAQYLCQTDEERLVNEAREFIEVALSLASYISYCECCAYKRGHGKTKLFKGFTQRSAGPLWSFLQECRNQIRDGESMCRSYNELLEGDFFNIIDRLIGQIADHKHGKLSAASIDTVRPIQIIANVSHKSFRDNYFGFFEQVQKEKFSIDYQGRFRIAHGRFPFISALEYTGRDAFSGHEAVILNGKTGSVLTLQPLIFWDFCKRHRDLSERHCYVFDKVDKKAGGYTFKAAGFNCTCNVSSDRKEYGVLAEQIERLRECDIKFPLFQGGSFHKIEFE